MLEDALAPKLVPEIVTVSPILPLNSGYRPLNTQIYLLMLLILPITRESGRTRINKIQQLVEEGEGNPEAFGAPIGISKSAGSAGCYDVTFFPVQQLSSSIL